jgi:DNA-binding CsgD family transcriptional regulator
MTKSEHTPLNKNELEIVKLTIEGESQRSIAKRLNLSPSAVCRTLQRLHVIDKIKSSTQDLQYPVYQQMMTNYARGQERIGREMDTMDIKDVIKYLGHTKPLIMAMVIEEVREKLKKERQAKEGPVKFQIEYSDTAQTIRREALRQLKEWGYDEPPEEVVN